jgi:hypothetical protein
MNEFRIYQRAVSSAESARRIEHEYWNGCGEFDGIGWLVQQIRHTYEPGRRRFVTIEIAEAPCLGHNKRVDVKSLLEGSIRIDVPALSKIG